MKNISFKSRFFLIVLTGVLSGLLGYFLMGLFEVPFRNAAFLTITSVVIAVFLGRMEKKFNEKQN